MRPNSEPMPALVRRLNLHNFRNYHSASLAAGAGTIALIGPNGAGKTNLIEAISFLAPGRGLRRTTLSEIAFALKIGTPVIGLRSWDLVRRGSPVDGIALARTPAQAVELALHQGRRTVRSEL